MKFLSDIYLYIFKNPVGSSDDVGYSKLNSKTWHGPMNFTTLMWLKIIIFDFVKPLFEFSSNSGSIIHSVFCLTTGRKPPPKWFRHIVRSRASSFKWQYPLLSLRTSSSFLRLLPRLLVTSISPFIFLSITCFRRQILRKMWPIQLAFRYPNTVIFLL